MRRTARALPLALATLLLASRGARAQCSGGRTSRFDAFDVAPAALQLPPATSAAFSAGWAVSSFLITVDPRGNGQQWYLCAMALSLDMGTVSGYTKPLADLQWSVDGATWTSFAFSSLQPILNGKGLQTITLLVRSQLAFGSDIPLANGSAATYGANLRFSVSM